MLRIIHQNNTLPYSWAVSPDDEFEPGMIAQLKLYGNQIVCGTSDGLQPIGIIDDMKKNSFSSSKVDEVVIVPVPSQLITESNGRYYTTLDIKQELEESNILSGSFVSRPVPVQLNAKHGVIIFPAGTQLNFKMTESGPPDAIRTVVRYSFQIAGVPGENTTEGSGQITVWTSSIIAATDQYDTSAEYPLNGVLFCGMDGKLTTYRVDETYPPVGIVTSPPTAIYSWLEFKSLF